MGLTGKLGAFNGIVVGTVFGLGLYAGSVGVSSVGELLLALAEVGGFAVGAASSGSVLAVVKVYPLAPVIAGAIAGLLGGAAAIVLPAGMPFPQQVVGGVIAAVVGALFVRFLPGL